MSGITSKNFNLPWLTHEHYWITIYPVKGAFTPELQQSLAQCGFRTPAGTGVSMQTPRQWKPVWDELYTCLNAANALDEVEIVLAAEAVADAPDASQQRKAPTVIQAIAGSLWLGEALLEDRVMCYLQPVVSDKDKTVGYESFVRVRATDGSIISGDKIIEASKALGIEYMFDRHLHVQAIKTFALSKLGGFLFINFFPGFIQRPAVYLEGLRDTAKNFGIMAKHIVLEFTKAETPHDIEHMKNICEFGRSHGYSIGLDDVESVKIASKLINEIRPDFVKIDMQLVRRADQLPERDTIRDIVDITHAGGGMAIGEGIETDAIHQQLKLLGVDLFQGYLFSPAGGGGEEISFLKYLPIVIQSSFDSIPRLI